MSHIFDAYSQYYDLLYQDKNYTVEAKYVASNIRGQAPQAQRLLELGCGTGAHAEYLARMGYFVHGVDMSEGMLSKAQARKAILPADVADRLSFELGDVRTVRTGEKYDAVISLFHVLSYQQTNDDVRAVFESAAEHLNSGGFFLFDFWYGPAVLKQQPDIRVKRLENEEVKVTRIAEPFVHDNVNIVDVSYSMFVEERLSGRITQLRELHPMRYFFLPELVHYHGCEWKVLKSEAWLSGGELNEQSWSAVQLIELV